MWKFVGSVFILTTKDSALKKDIQEHLTNAGFGDFQFFETIPAKKRINNGSGNKPLKNALFNNTECDEVCSNITSNHFSMIEKAYNLGLNRILILEDDARFDMPINIDKLKRVETWLNENDWDIFYFGSCPWPVMIYIPYSRDIVKTPSPQLAHSYLLNRKGMEKVLKHKDRRDFQIDVLLSKIDMLKFAIFPSICFQCVDPALYRQTKIPIPFRKISTTMEYISLLAPLVLVIIIVYAIYYCLRR